MGIIAGSSLGENLESSEMNLKKLKLTDGLHLKVYNIFIGITFGKIYKMWSSMIRQTFHIRDLLSETKQGVNNEFRRQLSHEALPEDILQLIKPQQVHGYAIAKGWQRVPNVNGGIALFNHPQGRFDQLIVPMDESFADYARRLRDVIENLAGFESRSVAEVLNDLHRQVIAD